MNLEELLLYRDGLILVINKPWGYAVHKSKGPHPALDDYFDQLKFGLPEAPKLAHRLDRETSGCLVLGRHANALRSLGHMFEKGFIEKTYWAIVEGMPPEEEGIIDAPLAPQSSRSNLWWTKVDPAGKPAVTQYKVLQRNEGECLLELKPQTGRTHQLRVHCAHMGFPIKGDRIYGNGDGDQKLCLHARSLLIPLNPKKEPIYIEAPPPNHF